MSDIRLRQESTHHINGISVFMAADRYADNIDHIAPGQPNDLGQLKTLSKMARTCCLVAPAAAIRRVKPTPLFWPALGPAGNGQACCGK